MVGGATGIDGVTPGWTPTISGLAGFMAFYVKASPSAELMALCPLRKDARASIIPVDIVANYLILASVVMPDNPVIRRINAFATDEYNITWSEVYAPFRDDAEFVENTEDFAEESKHACDKHLAVGVNR